MLPLSMCTPYLGGGGGKIKYAPYNRDMYLLCAISLLSPYYLPYIKPAPYNREMLGVWEVVVGGWEGSMSGIV